MALNTVIFDMDGLLIDSEPLWNEAANDTFRNYGIQLTATEYAKTTGLRTKEFLEFWFTHFKIPPVRIAEAEKRIIKTVIGLVKQKGEALPGVPYIFDFFVKRNFNIGLATSSPPDLINVIIDLLELRPYLRAISSANELAYGKPHPEVYLNCAEKLKVPPGQCICFEDSYNGMIAAKAAKMKCVMIPAPADQNKPVWEAADLKISSLYDFNDGLLKNL
ncbi:MAG TPA: hexitol phosphatase HxpB [Ferruginibacter sp.]|nr:hexitol phosphatase HxpB [Ferruginibacter sp.]